MRGLSTPNFQSGGARPPCPSLFLRLCTVNTSKLKENMDLAIEANIHRVNGCPCGKTVIHLFQGADSTEQQEMCDKLLVFLKGSNAKASAG